MRKADLEKQSFRVTQHANQIYLSYQETALTARNNPSKLVMVGARTNEQGGEKGSVKCVRTPSMLSTGELPYRAVFANTVTSRSP